MAPDGEGAGSARQVTRRGGFAPIESIDGRYVYFSPRHPRNPDPENAIWRMPVDGGDEEVVVKSLRSSWGNWDVTANGIWYLAGAVFRSTSSGRHRGEGVLSFGRFLTSRMGWGMAAASSQEVTRLLRAWSRGDETALEALIPVIYRELRQRAHRYDRLAEKASDARQLWDRTGSCTRTG